MTHLALLIPTLDEIGGAERQLLLLAKAFATRGWRVTVIALSGRGGAAAAQLEADGVAFLSLGMRKAWIDPRGWMHYLAWHSTHRPDVVHAHLPHASFFARFVRLLAPVPVLVDTIHTIHLGTRARRFLYRLSSPFTDHVTCVGQSVAQAVRSARFAPADRLSVLHNAIEIAGCAGAQAQPSGLPFRWIAVGRLAAVKDYPTLLRAFAQLPGEPRLTVAGRGPHPSELMQLACTLAVEDRVHFAGFVANVQPLLAAADAFVLASLWEGLPVSILEASAAGLPVVATGTAGACEAIVPGQTGLLAPAGDAAALAKVMTAVMNMPPEERAEMGSRGREFAAANFSLTAIASRWEELYMRLLSSHPKPSRWHSPAG